MVRHSAECRDRGYPFVADPSQQLARMEGDATRKLIDGAAYLLTNQYEKGLLEAKTGLSHDDLLDRVGVCVTTLGADGVRIEGREVGVTEVAAAKEATKSDPTGVGDGFRAGFFAGLSWGLPLERSAQVGSLLATLVLETVGTQEYDIKPARFVERLADSYGSTAAAEIATHLPAE